MRLRFHLLLGALAVCCFAARAEADIVLRVGPKAPYQTVTAAVSVADADTNPANYYVIEVAPGTYTNDFPAVTRPMTIEVDPAKAGHAVILKATEALPNEKGIILSTADLTVIGLTLEGAEISNDLGGNGAGIRDQNPSTPATLIVENSAFIGNQEGILTGDNPAQSISIISSTFKNNGNPNINYFQHGLYVNEAGSLTVTSSVFCGQLIGHDIKSRAMMTNVSDSQLYDGDADSAIGCRTGSSSFAVDIPNGGIATITGNVIIQGAASQNYKMIAYGEEGLLYSQNSLLVSDNSFTSIGSEPATGIYDPDCIAIQLTGDTFSNIATPVDPASCVV
ncbi:MAG TPA: hypothetical protein VMF05_15175, partial [Stellaceae bacterium]|nr:hypothetical protein [Stellaceae bacterium]